MNTLIGAFVFIWLIWRGKLIIEKSVPSKNKTKKMRLLNTMPPAATKYKKFFSFKVKVKVHKIIDLGVIWKDAISGVCMSNMRSMSYS